jgi:ligand-binding SRPBCC domain-containing protein
MKIHTLEQEQLLPIALDEAWSFFSSPRNLDEITPPELGFKIESCRSDVMHEGQIITYKVMVFPGIWIPWVTEIKAVEEGKSFIDEQRFGPYAFWHHRHTFEAVEGGVKMGDIVHYGMPFGPLGSLVHALFVRAKLKRIFGFRRAVLEQRFPGQVSA